MTFKQFFDSFVSSNMQDLNSDATPEGQVSTIGPNQSGYNSGAITPQLRSERDVTNSYRTLRNQNGYIESNESGLPSFNSNLRDNSTGMARHFSDELLQEEYK